MYSAANLCPKWMAASMENQLMKSIRIYSTTPAAPALILMSELLYQ
jgi:hypothetical protein